MIFEKKRLTLKEKALVNKIENAVNAGIFQMPETPYANYNELKLAADSIEQTSENTAVDTVPDSKKDANETPPRKKLVKHIEKVDQRNTDNDTPADGTSFNDSDVFDVANPFAEEVDMSTKPYVLDAINRPSDEHDFLEKEDDVQPQERKAEELDDSVQDPFIVAANAIDDGDEDEYADEDDAGADRVSHEDEKAKARATKTATEGAVKALAYTGTGLLEYLARKIGRISDNKVDEICSESDVSPVAIVADGMSLRDIAEKFNEKSEELLTIPEEQKEDFYQAFLLVAEEKGIELTPTQNLLLTGGTIAAGLLIKAFELRVSLNKKVSQLVVAISEKTQREKEQYRRLEEMMRKMAAQSEEIERLKRMSSEPVIIENESHKKENTTFTEMVEKNSDIPPHIENEK